MVDCCLKTDGLGYQIFNVANEDSSVGIKSSDVTEQFYQGVPVKREMGKYETFYDISKAKKLLGYAPKHGWRDTL